MFSKFYWWVYYLLVVNVLQIFCLQVMQITLSKMIFTFQEWRFLELLDNWEPSNAEISAEHNKSTLSWWLATDNNAAIKQYLDSGLPSSISYRLEATHGSQNEVIVDRAIPDGEVSTSFRVVWSDNEILGLAYTYGTDIGRPNEQ